MDVVIRESTPRPEAQERVAAASAAFAAIRARRPGHRGSVSVEAGAGRRVTVTLWESEPAQAAAARVLPAPAERRRGAPRSGPSRVVDQGPAIGDGLTTR